MSDPFNKEKWATVGADLRDAWDSIKTTATHVFTGVKDIITSTIDEFITLGTEAPKIGEQLKEAYSTAIDLMRASMDLAFDGLRQGGEDLRTDLGQTADAAVEMGDVMDWVSKSTIDAYHAMTIAGLGLPEPIKKAAEEAKKSWGETFDDLSKNITEAINEFGQLSKETGFAIDALVAHVTEAANSILGAFSSAFSQIFEIQGMRLDGMQVLLDNDYKARKRYIENNVKDEEERKTQLTALEEEYNAKSAKIKKQQWLAQRDAAVVSAIISTAKAVMETFATFGWPLGVIPAAIMGALGLVQIGTIASQPVPDFAAAEGGVFPGGSNILVGERGPEVVQLGRTSRIVPSGELGTGMGIQLTNRFYGDINNELDFDSLSIRQALRLKRALRA